MNFVHVADSSKNIMTTKNSKIQDTPNLSTNADSSSDSLFSTAKGLFRKKNSFFNNEISGFGPLQSSYKGDRVLKYQ